MPFLFLFIWCGNAFSDDSNIQDIYKIRMENRLLELEAKAAAKPVTYVVLDLIRKKYRQRVASLKKIQNGKSLRKVLGCIGLGRRY